MDKRVAFIIEDNVELGYIYAAALEMANFKVERLIDGQSAVDRLDTAIPDLIVLDMNLPYVSGQQIYQRLRQDRRFDNTPIIIATANSLLAETLPSQLTGQDCLLIKPVSPSKLRELTRQFYPQNQSLSYR
jgi:DNA-binding response OmpR family regulator